MERKIFTKEELSYLNFAMEKCGCYGLDETNEEYKCPYWDWELRDDKDNEGECSIKHSEKLCILMQVAQSGELSLTLRDKTSNDEETDKVHKRGLIQQKIDFVEQNVIEHQQKLIELERQQRKLGG